LPRNGKAYDDLGITAATAARKCWQIPKPSTGKSATCAMDAISRLAYRRGVGMKWELISPAT
jgi:hypothetical protein